MNISASPFSAGLSALKSGQQQLTEAAQSIAQSSSTAANTNTATAAAMLDTTAISEQLMMLEQAKIMSQLGAKVLSSAEESLGTLIDIQS